MLFSAVEHGRVYHAFMKTPDALSGLSGFQAVMGAFSDKDSGNSG